VAKKEQIGPIDPAALWSDWMTIWQSEFAAMAQDREIAESLAATTQLWSTLAAATLAARVPGAGTQEEADAESARTGTTTGTPAAAAAPGAGGDVVVELERRIAELERRLDALAPAVPTTPPRRRRAPRNA
jgi:hypothetical protein